MMNTVSLDQSIQELQEKKEKWVKLSIQKKIGYVEQLIKGTKKVAERQVLRAIQAKGISPDTPTEGEEWLGGPMVTLRNLRLLLQTLQSIAKTGNPSISRDKVRTRSNGQVIVKVIPESRFDSLLYADFHGEVWMQPEVTQHNLMDHVASFYKEKAPQGKVALVLGAGNVASIGPLDVVYKLFVEGQVCLLKWNPVNEYLGPFLEEAFAPLYKDGFLRSAYGGADVGSYLCQHQGVEEIHITGSDKTHDAIVFGIGEEGKQRKKENKALLDKRITSELGNVSPLIIVPGRWSEKELQYQAQNVATQMTNNAGFNCNAAKMIITHAAWDQRSSFLNTLRDILKQIGPRKAYYPGAHQRHQHFVSKHPEAKLLGSKTDAVVPWTLISGLDPEQSNDICFQEESFCGVTGETSLQAADASDFFKKAIDFCNNTLWGTLNASVIIQPKIQEQLGTDFEDGLAALRYGSIAINHWPALSYAMGCTTWGAYPGHTPNDIQSGIGVVHNTYMFDKPQKSIIYGPFTSWPRPPWFAPYKENLHKMAKILTYFEAKPRWRKLPQIFWNALKS